MRDPRNSGRLPLLSAYRFIESHGMREEVQNIRDTRVKFKSYNSVIRRGKVVRLLERKGMLEQFIESEWPRGLTDRGRSQIRACKDVYQRFLQER